MITFLTSLFHGLFCFFRPLRKLLAQKFQFLQKLLQDRLFQTFRKFCAADLGNTPHADLIDLCLFFFFAYGKFIFDLLVQTGVKQLAEDHFFII